MTNYTTELSLTCLPFHKNYRTALEFIALILEAVKKNSATRYPIKKYTKTNYAQLQKYLELLTGMDFIETDTKEEKVSYRLSERGLAFLRQYNILRDILLNAYYRNKAVDIAQENTTDFAIPVIKQSWGTKVSMRGQVTPLAEAYCKH